MRRSNRRSGRIPLSMRLVITPAESQKLFRADSQTINVSAHGARICANVDLQTDMQIRVFQPWRNRLQIARVIWAHTTGVRQYGIELLSEEDFWGIHFPTDRGEELEAAVNSSSISEQNPEAGIFEVEEFPSIPVGPGVSYATTPQAHRADVILGPDPKLRVPDRVQPEGEAPFLLEIPQSGLAVVVSGLTMAGTPFRENGVFLPQGTERNTAYLWLRSVIRDGSKLRVFFPNDLVTTVHVRATLDTRTAAKETLAVVELPPDIYVSAGEMA